MTKPPNAGLIATQASGPPRKPGEAEIIVAERQFADAKVQAEAIKQSAIGAAMILPMPEHLAAIRAAEQEFHLSCAKAAAETGLIDPAPYLAAATA